MGRTLRDEEASVRQRILAGYVSNLLAEIKSTDDYDLRRKLQVEEALVRNLIARLAADHE